MNTRMLARRADVVIIGAGVMGASIAYYLARENIRAVVLEKEEVASGSSGACEGLLLLQSKKPGLHLELALASLERFPGLTEALHGNIEYERKGGLVVIESEAEFTALQGFVEKQKKYGVEIFLLDCNQTREKEPALSKHILGAAFSPLDGQVNPLSLTAGFLRSAQQKGTQVVTRTRVQAIELDHGRVVAVVTNNGKIETRLVINAAGAFAAEIGAMVNLSIPIKPRRGQILVTEAVPPILKCCLLSAKYIAAKFDPKIAGAGEAGFAIEQTGSGNILIGSTREFIGFEKYNSFNGIHTIASNVLRVLPGIKNVRMIRAFAGLRPYTPDGLPILGKVEAIDGFIMAAGHEGDGITLAPITGAMIAQLVSTGSAPLLCDELRLERFL